MLRPHDLSTIAEWLINREKFRDAFKQPLDPYPRASALVGACVSFSLGTDFIEGVRDIASFDDYGVFPTEEPAFRAVIAAISDLNEAK